MSDAIPTTKNRIKGLFINERSTNRVYLNLSDKSSRYRYNFNLKYKLTDKRIYLWKINTHDSRSNFIFSIKKDYTRGIRVGGTYLHLILCLRVHIYLWYVNLRLTISIHLPSTCDFIFDYFVLFC